MHRGAAGARQGEKGDLYTVPKQHDDVSSQGFSGWELQDEHDRDCQSEHGSRRREHEHVQVLLSESRVIDALITFEAKP